ncbi:hypothetical protein GC194_11140 [bacterium]|nr:hypothetical protein [bacterium]
MKHFTILALVLCAGLLLSSCNKDKVDITVSADKSSLKVGETITFATAFSNADYDCAAWWISDKTGATVTSETGIKATAVYSVEFSPTTAGDFTFKIEAYPKCDGGIGTGKEGKDYFSASTSFTVSE